MLSKWRLLLKREHRNNKRWIRCGKLSLSSAADTWSTATATHTNLNHWKCCSHHVILQTAKNGHWRTACDDQQHSCHLGETKNANRALARVKTTRGYWNRPCLRSTWNILQFASGSHTQGFINLNPVPLFTSNVTYYKPITTSLIAFSHVKHFLTHAKALWTWKPQKRKLRQDVTYSTNRISMFFNNISILEVGSNVLE